MCGLCMCVHIYMCACTMTLCIWLRLKGLISYVCTGLLWSVIHTRRIAKPGFMLSGPEHSDTQEPGTGGIGGMQLVPHCNDVEQYVGT